MQSLRLDELLVERGFFDTIHAAQAAVLAGEVIVGFHRETSAGKRLKPDVEIRIKNQKNFVSRGGKKLEAALNTFNVNVKNCNCVDLGASSGGFTDCLLQHGASHVSAVDVGYGQFVWALRNDERVTLYERTNVRNLDPQSIGGPFDIVVGDLSFVSLKLLMPDIYAFCKNNAHAILLIKPQFEAKKEEIGAGGVVYNKDIHVRVLSEIIISANAEGFSCQDLTFSPIRGPKGNIEYLIFLSLDKIVKNNSTIQESFLSKLVYDAHEQLGGKS